MMKLLAQLKRRQMFRIAAAYAVVAWLLLQLFNNLAPILELPSWVGRAFVLLLAIGFPAAMFFAWMRELPPAESAADIKTNKLDWILVGGLAAVIAIFAFQQLAPTGTTSAQQHGVEAAKAVSSTPASGISLAVLPFANLSSDPEQEFFSDGITEEITSALARIPDLGVVARTSAFQFKGQNRDLRAVGQSLGATHLIEGSVRKAGDQVRITAQLIQADNGLHVWTDSYDRNLADIFAIQEEVARAIAGALRMPLGLQPGETLVSNRGIDPESYEQYLRAKSLFRVRGRSNIADAFNIMEQVVARNPDYAPAWALLADIYRTRGNASRQEEAARRAIELDPNLADGYVALGVVELGRQKLVLAEDRYKQALALDPNNEGVLFAYGNLLGAVGRVREYLAMMQRLRALEPFVPLYNGNLSDALWLNGQDEAAIAILKALPGGLPGGMSPGGLLELARIYSASGRYSEAADAMLALSAMNVSPEVAAISKEAARLLRTAPAKYPSPQDLPRLRSAAFVDLYIGAEGRALEEYEEHGEAGRFAPDFIALLWHPSYAPVRKTERFKAYVRKAGLVDYWRVKGWPEFCRPTAGDDFECD